MTKARLSFAKVNASGAPMTLTVGSNKVEGWDNAKWQATLNAAGYSAKADPAPEYCNAANDPMALNERSCTV